jgi:hypothetical protein
MGDQKTQQTPEYPAKSHEKHDVKSVQTVESAAYSTDSLALSRLNSAGSLPLWSSAAWKIRFIALCCGERTEPEGVLEYYRGFLCELCSAQQEPGERGCPVAYYHITAAMAINMLEFMGYRIRLCLTMREITQKDLMAEKLQDKP